MVNLVREPANKYDHNAVKVTNVAGQQVGHIKRELAKALAFILDFHMARVEGLESFFIGLRISVALMSYCGETTPS